MLVRVAADTLAIHDRKILAANIDVADRTILHVVRYRYEGAIRDARRAYSVIARLRPGERSRGYEQGEGCKSEISRQAY